MKGLQTVLISDRDGATIYKASNVAEADSDVGLAATFAVASEQASKLRLGKNQTISSFFEKRTVFHVQHFPLIVSFIGDVDLNIGVLGALVPDIRKSLEGVKKSFVESGKADDQ